MPFRSKMTLFATPRALRRFVYDRLRFALPVVVVAFVLLFQIPVVAAYPLKLTTYESVSFGLTVQKWGEVTVLDRSSLPASLTSRCPEENGDVLMTALHVMVHGSRRNPHAPAKAVIRIGTHPKKRDVTLCGALPPRDLVIFQANGFLAPHNTAKLKVAPSDVVFKRTRNLRLLGYPAYGLTLKETCSPDSFTCGYTLESTITGYGYEAGQFRVASPGAKVSLNGLSGSALVKNREVVGHAMRRLSHFHDEHVLVIPVSRKALSQSTDKWVHPPVLEYDDLIAETIRPPSLAPSTPSPPVCKWTPGAESALSDLYARYGQLLCSGA